MLALFKWMATHPDVSLEIEHISQCENAGYLQLTMRHRLWGSCARELFIIDLLEAAQYPDEMVTAVLDNHYRQLLSARVKELDRLSKKGGEHE